MDPRTTTCGSEICFRSGKCDLILKEHTYVRFGCKWLLITMINCRPYCLKSVKALAVVSDGRVVSGGD